MSVQIDRRRAQDLAQLDARSFASAPLVVRRHVISPLSIVSTVAARDERDVWTLANFARQAAASIENARLLEAERHARDRITRIQQVTSALSSARTAEEVAEVTCRIGAHAMEASGSVLWLTDGPGRLVIAGSWGRPSEWISAFSALDPDDPRFRAVRIAPIECVLRAIHAVEVGAIGNRHCGEPPERPERLLPGTPQARWRAKLPGGPALPSRRG